MEKNTVQENKSVDNLLFNLTEEEVKEIFDHYFDIPRATTIAVFELLEHCREEACVLEDVSVDLHHLRAITTVSLVEKMRSPFERYKLYSRNQEERKKAEIDLHASFVELIQHIESTGIYEFNGDVAYSVDYVKTREAILDTILALSCATSLYIAYDRAKNRGLI